MKTKRERHNFHDIAKKGLETCILKYGKPFQKTEKFIESRKNTSIDRYGVENPSQAKSIKEKIRISNESSGNWTKQESLEYFELYKRKVRNISDKFRSNLKNIEKVGQKHINDEAYEVDHIFSIYDGFNNNIPTYIIGDIVNLKCIPWKENNKKRTTSLLTIEELYELFY